MYMSVNWFTSDLWNVKPSPTLELIYLQVDIWEHTPQFRTGTQIFVFNLYILICPLQNFHHIVGFDELICRATFIEYDSNYWSEKQGYKKKCVTYNTMNNPYFIWLQWCVLVRLRRNLLKIDVSVCAKMKRCLMNHHSKCNNLNYTYTTTTFTRQL